MQKLDRITVGGLLDRIATKFPDHDALVYTDRNLRYTYHQFNQLCRQVAKGLMALGLKRGEHIAIWATNVPEWVTLQFATGKMGAVLVTVNTNYKTFEVEYLLKQSDTTTLVMIGGTKTSNYINIINELCPELRDSQPGKLNSARLPMLKNVIFIGEDTPAGMWNWRDILAMANQVTDEELDARQASLDPDDCINMQYTSGTTGFPKGVMLTHFNIINNAHSIADCMNFTEQDKLCIPVPFFHCFGCVLGTMTCVVSGATMVPVEVFHPVRVLETIEQERCTAVHGVPTMFIMELEELDKKNMIPAACAQVLWPVRPAPLK